MSSRNGAPIDFQAWAQNQIVKRTEAALKERDAAFAERHAETPLPQLARYLHRCSLSLGHSPSPNEVDGGSFIEERFGSWEAAMRLAKLPLPTSMRKLKDTARYKQEKVRQEPLFREERKRRNSSSANVQISESTKWLLRSVRKSGQSRVGSQEKAEAEAKAAALEASLAENVADTGVAENEPVTTPIQEIVCAEAAAEVLCAADAVDNASCPAAEPAAACAETSPCQAETV